MKREIKQLTTDLHERDGAVANVTERASNMERTVRDQSELLDRKSTELEVWWNIFGVLVSCVKNLFITARKRSLRRLCFYTCLSVILFTGGVCIGGGRVGQTPLPIGYYGIWSTSRRYTSYWNPFFIAIFSACRRSCEKVMFLRLSICTRGWLPSMHYRSHDQGVCLQRGVCIYWGGLHPRDRPTPPGTRKVSGTYPVGMLSCWIQCHAPNKRTCWWLFIIIILIYCRFKLSEVIVGVSYNYGTVKWLLLI